MSLLNFGAMSKKGGADASLSDCSDKVAGHNERDVKKSDGEEESLLAPRKKPLPPHRKLAYGVGHVFNDMCASMWFTYLLLFYHMVVRLSNTYAGLLLLIGQIADASATPVVGFLCDRTRCRYGRRKIWHLIGTIMVAVSFFFFWHRCLPCVYDHEKQQTAGNGTHNSVNDSGDPYTHDELAGKLGYFAVFIVIFQVGWATVQVSHLSLIPELTDNESERVGLNAIRYSFTILSNVGVFVTVFLLLQFVAHSENINPHDEWIFSDGLQTRATDMLFRSIEMHDIVVGVSLGIIAVGLVFSLFFHLGTVEPSTPMEQRQECAQGKKIPWYEWFLNPHFYLVAVVYMCTRLIVNLTQVYTPLYLVDSLKLPKTSVAIGPLVIFVSGFIATLAVRRFNKIIGRYMTYFCGLAFVWGALIWFWFIPSSTNPQGEGPTIGNVVYGAAILLGAGASTLLVTSLSMVADLIGCTVGSSAFVYGAMSFTDKLSNGIAIQIIQAMHPCKGTGADPSNFSSCKKKAGMVGDEAEARVCCSGCTPYYHGVLVFVPGGASLVTTVALGFLVLMVYRRRRQCRDVAPPVCADKLEGDACISSSNENRTIQSPGEESDGDSDDTCQEEDKPLLHAHS